MFLVALKTFNLLLLFKLQFLIVHSIFLKFGYPKQGTQANHSSFVSPTQVCVNKVWRLVAHVCWWQKGSAFFWVRLVFCYTTFRFAREELENNHVKSKDLWWQFLSKSNEEILVSCRVEMLVPCCWKGFSQKEGHSQAGIIDFVFLFLINLEMKNLKN